MPEPEDITDAFPEIDLIESDLLREKVTEAWTIALEEGEYEHLDEVPGLPMVDVDNLTHSRGVTNLARNMAQALNESDGVDINLDYVTAAAICHDLGKVFEYTELDSGQWLNGTWETSRPTIRHPVYSVSIARSLDFPLEVIHAIGSHSREGEHVIRNQEAAIVSSADHVYWRVVIPDVTGKSIEKVLY